MNVIAMACADPTPCAPLMLTAAAVITAGLVGYLVGVVSGEKSVRRTP